MQLPPKLWFKLQRLKTSIRSMFGKQDQNYETALRMCPSCRALIDRSASVCPLCGAHVRSARSRPSPTPGRVAGGVIPVPTSANTIIMAFTIVIYAITWFMTQRAASAAMQSAPSFGGIASSVLIRMGAKCPLIFAGQWWRLVTAIFLHAGLIHIGFNLWCLFDIGPIVESLFGATKYIVLYLVTGVFGYVVSLWWRPLGVSIGASGAIMGLIGILIGASFHHGAMGKDLRRQLRRVHLRPVAWIPCPRRRSLDEGWRGTLESTRRHFSSHYCWLICPDGTEPFTPPGVIEIPVGACEEHSVCQGLLTGRRLPPPQPDNR